MLTGPPGAGKTVVARRCYGRSPLCTLALAGYLQRPVTRRLADAVARAVDERLYERDVFFVEHRASWFTPQAGASAMASPCGSARSTVASTPPTGSAVAVAMVDVRHRPDRVAALLEPPVALL